MQALYELVAAAAPQHLIVVDGPNYAANPPSVLLRADHGELVYALPPYSCSIPGASCDATTHAAANLSLLNRWKPLAATAPVLVTEMGWPVYPHGDGTGYVDGAAYYRQTIAYVDRQSPQWGFVACVRPAPAAGRQPDTSALTQPGTSVSTSRCQAALMLRHCSSVCP